MRPTDPRVGPWLASRFGGGGPEACPDANRLAGLARGALDADERDAVLRHLGACEECRGAVAALAEAGVHPAAVDAVPASGGAGDARGRVLRFPWGRAGLALAGAAAIAAAVLLVIGPRPTAPSSTDDRLAAAAAELARVEPSLAGFRPLDAAERDAVESAVARGGLVVLAPAGRTGSSRPALRWRPVPGASSYDVVVTGEDGRDAWKGTSSGPSATVAGAELPPGAYVATVKSRGPVASETGRRSFEVVGGAERARHEAARAAIASRAPADLKDLLHAHLALRDGWWSEAEEAARAAAAAAPDDRVARDTLRSARRLLGDPAAEAGGP
jgi:hypothetical protein